MCCFAGCVELITVSTPHKRVNVTVGESVLLQCMFDTISDTKGLTIQWDFDSPSSIAPQQVGAAHTRALRHKCDSNVKYCQLVVEGCCI